MDLGSTPADVTTGGRIASAHVSGPADEDPGWGRFVPNLLAIVPGGLQYLNRRSGRTGIDGLVALRRVFLAFPSTLVLVAFVAVSMASSFEPALPPLPVGAAVASYGGLALLGSRLLEKPLDCASDQALAVAYRTRMFLRLAFAESAALLGFVGVTLTAEAWVFGVGIPFAVFGLLRAAPGRGNLERDQEALVLSGCGRSLLTTLRGPTTSSAVQQ